MNLGRSTVARPGIVHAIWLADLEGGVIVEVALPLTTHDKVELARGGHAEFEEVQPYAADFRCELYCHAAWGQGEPTTTPEDTLREAGIPAARRARKEGT